MYASISVVFITVAQNDSNKKFISFKKNKRPTSELEKLGCNNKNVGVWVSKMLFIDTKGNFAEKGVLSCDPLEPLRFLVWRENKPCGVVQNMS